MARVAYFEALQGPSDEPVYGPQLSNFITYVVKVSAVNQTEKIVTINGGGSEVKLKK